MKYILRSCWVYNEHVRGFDVFAVDQKELIEKARIWCPESIERIT